MSQNTPSHTAAGGLDRLVEIAAAQPLSQACDHFYFLRHVQTECNARRTSSRSTSP